MASLIMELYNNYQYVLEIRSDERVKDWFLMDSPMPTIAICVVYVYFVKVLGPKLMENHKPFNLRRIMMWYNILQVCLSGYMFGVATYLWTTVYSWRCQPVDYSYRPLAMFAARTCWLYYMTKLLDLTDTLFFVLRKKYEHISTLHVVHHATMLISTWVGVKFVPGGHGTFLGFLNTFVHTIMYTYYLLAAMGPQMRPYLWWKKYLTTLQMVQFVLVGIHSSQLFFIECNFPKPFLLLIIVHAFMFFALFNDFYQKAYNRGDNKAMKQSAEVQSSDAKENNVIYANQYKMATGYISDNGLKHRVFLDNQSVNEAQ